MKRYSALMRTGLREYETADLPVVVCSGVKQHVKNMVDFAGSGEKTKTLQLKLLFKKPSGCHLYVQHIYLKPKFY